MKRKKKPADFVKACVKDYKARGVRPSYDNLLSCAVLTGGMQKAYYARRTTKQQRLWLNQARHAASNMFHKQRWYRDEYRPARGSNKPF